MTKAVEFDGSIGGFSTPERSLSATPSNVSSEEDNPAQPVRGIRLLLIRKFPDMHLSQRPCEGRAVKATPIMHGDGFYQNGNRSTDAPRPAAMHFRKKHRVGYNLRSVARKCQQSGFYATGIWMEFRIGKVHECTHRAERRLNWSIPQSDLLSYLKSDVAEKKKATISRVATDPPPKDAKENDPVSPENSSSSESHMPDIVTSDGNGMGERRQKPKRINLADHQGVQFRRRLRTTRRKWIRWCKIL